MNNYKFVESEDGTGTLKKEVKHEGQPSEWVDDMKTPLPFFDIATKDYVRKKVKEADPNFKGTYTSMADIEAIDPVNANDWAYLQSQDESGNDVYSRYRYAIPNGETQFEWVFEVAIKRDNFTDEEWAAITSGITQEKVEKLDSLSDTTRRPFKGSWHTDTTLLQFCQDVAADSDAQIGDVFLGGLSCSGLPDGMGNGEVTVEILSGAASIKLIRLTLTSTNLHPYHWEQSYFNGTLYGWKEWIMPLEVSDVTALSSSMLDRLKNGYIVVKVVGDRKYTYLVVYKDVNLGELSLVYCDHETIEEVYYEKRNGVWTYIQTDTTPLDAARLAEIDELVGDRTFQSVELDNEGNVIGVYRTLDDEEESNE